MRRALAMSSISALALLAAAAALRLRLEQRLDARRGRRRRVGGGGAGGGGRRRRRSTRRTMNCGDPLRADRSDRAHRRHGDARLHDDPHAGGPHRRLVGGRRSDVAGRHHHAERRRRRRSRSRGGRCGSLYAMHVTGQGFTSWAVLSVSMGWGSVDGGAPGLLPYDAHYPDRRHVLGAHRRHVVQQGPLRDQRQVLASRGRHLRSTAAPTGRSPATTRSAST